MSYVSLSTRHGIWCSQALRTNALKRTVYRPPTSVRPNIMNGIIPLKRRREDEDRGGGRGGEGEEEEEEGQGRGLGQGRPDGQPADGQPAVPVQPQPAGGQPADGAQVPPPVYRPVNRPVNWGRMEQRLVEDRPIRKLPTAESAPLPLRVLPNKPLESGVVEPLTLQTVELMPRFAEVRATSFGLEKTKPTETLIQPHQYTADLPRTLSAKYVNDSPEFNATPVNVPEKIKLQQVVKPKVPPKPEGLKPKAEDATKVVVVPKPLVVKRPDPTFEQPDRETILTAMIGPATELEKLAKELRPRVAQFTLGRQWVMLEGQMRSLVEELQTITSRVPQRQPMDLDLTPSTFDYIKYAAAMEEASSPLDVVTIHVLLSAMISSPAFFVHTVVTGGSVELEQFPKSLILQDHLIGLAKLLYLVKFPNKQALLSAIFHWGVGFDYDVFMPLTAADMLMKLLSPEVSMATRMGLPGLPFADVSSLADYRTELTSVFYDAIISEAGRDRRQPSWDAIKTRFTPWQSLPQLPFKDTDSLPLILLNDDSVSPNTPFADRIGSISVLLQEAFPFAEKMHRALTAENMLVGSGEGGLFRLIKRYFGTDTTRLPDTPNDAMEHLNTYKKSLTDMAHENVALFRLIEPPRYDQTTNRLIPYSHTTTNGELKSPNTLFMQALTQSQPDRILFSVLERIAGKTEMEALHKAIWGSKRVAFNMYEPKKMSAHNLTQVAIKGALAGCFQGLDYVAYVLKMCDDAGWQVGGQTNTGESVNSKLKKLFQYACAYEAYILLMCSSISDIDKLVPVVKTVFRSKTLTMPRYDVFFVNKKGWETPKGGKVVDVDANPLRYYGDRDQMIHSKFILSDLYLSSRSTKDWSKPWWELMEAENVRLAKMIHTVYKLPKLEVTPPQLQQYIDMVPQLKTRWV
ncbi:protein ORF48 [Anguillid herpesvirus 1]|uniref:Protein ORF48 n=1 Tax=Anguillid herpesvirus 1 TaxID=150286 RepID=A0A8E5EVA2_9VIRU|nr:protein ORF48 [Anguillid herpesvirus 1]ADA57811.1 protein ORF48 [Anguillid herpesvirus 1]QRM16341.1 protein ORF48 [Anguillid herpesvirus 1]QRM16600.1 protein ORF48 [Anguillid herpesvirus 1]